MKLNGYEYTAILTIQTHTYKLHERKNKRIKMSCIRDSQPVLLRQQINTLYNFDKKQFYIQF